MLRTIPPTATDIKIFFDGENTEVIYNDVKENINTFAGENNVRANFHSFIGENNIVGNKIVKVINNLIN